MICEDCAAAADAATRQYTELYIRKVIEGSPSSMLREGHSMCVQRNRVRVRKLGVAPDCTCQHRLLAGPAFMLSGARA